jgi:hypothetical protein
MAQFNDIITDFFKPGIKVTSHLHCKPPHWLGKAAAVMTEQGAHAAGTPRVRWLIALVLKLC